MKWFFIYFSDSLLNVSQFNDLRQNRAEKNDDRLIDYSNFVIPNLPCRQAGLIRNLKVI